MTHVHAVPDPRETITPESFAIAPELLGLPLARPWRRAAAILTDLALCGILVALLGAMGVLLGAIGAVLLFRITPGKADASRTRRALRGTARLSGAMVVFIAFVSIWYSVNSWGSDDDEEETIGAIADTGAGELSLAGLGLPMADLATLFGNPSEAEARRTADRITASLVREGLDAEEAAELRAALEEPDLDALPLSPIAVEALRQALANVAMTGGPAPVDTALSADSLAVAYAAALTRGDSAAASSLRPKLAESLSATELAALRRRGRRLERRVDRLEEENERLENEREGVGLFGLLWATLHELGLGFGWMMLYFTAFTASWRGRTPGKRLFGMRVIRLDGKPIGWWAAFERFGGYAAAITTGLLGFLQILWDRNRQGIQDKIAGTVVIRE